MSHGRTSTTKILELIDRSVRPDLSQIEACSLVNQAVARLRSITVRKEPFNLQI